MRTACWAFVFGLLASTVPLLATSNGEPIRRTGLAADGGQTCTQCHNQFAPPVNQGPGRIVINTNSYTPGVKQNLTVQVSDIQALRWGFQLAARLATDETRQAGAFTANDTIRVLCDPIGEAPCNGQVEFATHRATSSLGGTAGTRTFVVEWTPPGRDVGQIIFYGAGLASNNDGTESGDRTYTSSFKIASAGCNFTSAPADFTVTNGASFEPGISSNSLITIIGAGFAKVGDSYQASKSDLVNSRLLPSDLACVAVEIGGRKAPIWYVQNDQINAQAPALDGSGPAQTVVILNPGLPNELRSAAFPTQIQSLAPAFFTYPRSSSIAGRNASNGNSVLADPALITGGVFAKPGDIVTLYGTGFGLTNPVYAPSEFATGPARLQQAVTVTIGGTVLPAEDVLYAGLSPDAPGFYQFNLRIPLSTSDGAIPVSIRIGSAQTQSGVTIPVKR